MKVLVIGRGVGGSASTQPHAAGLERTVFEKSGSIRQLGVVTNMLLNGQPSYEIKIN